jgi:hypothetical protein
MYTVPYIYTRCQLSEVKRPGLARTYGERDLGDVDGYYREIRSCVQQKVNTSWPGGAVLFLLLHLPALLASCKVVSIYMFLSPCVRPPVN